MTYIPDHELGQFISKLQQRLHTKDCGTEYRTLWQVLHLDLPLLLALFALIVFGIIILYSASSEQISLILRVGVNLSLSLVILFTLAQISPMTYQRWSPYVFAIGVILLFAVAVLGHIGKGAQRWLDLGIIHLQPSELMKLALPMILAWYFRQRELPPKMKDILFIGFITLIPVGLTLIQPDLGTAIVLCVSIFCVLFFAGIPWKFMVSVAMLGLMTAPILWHFMHDYQKQRLLIFLNPERDPLGAGYHIIQSKIAIGAGGIFGQGWLQGTQSHLQFLPEHTTDFIFAVCGEEFGLIGCIFLLTLYLCIIARSFYIALKAQDTYTRLLASSLTLMFFVGVFVNIGMVSGILPVVGLPLPLVSYGGSSMITTLASFGILMSIHHHRTLANK